MPSSQHPLKAFWLRWSSSMCFLSVYFSFTSCRLIQSVSSFVQKTTKDPTRQVIILGMPFSLLIESASGFGIGIVIAPILIALDRFNCIRQDFFFSSLVSLPFSRSKFLHGTFFSLSERHYNNWCPLRSQPFPSLRWLKWWPVPI